jgi:hypothetical protein
MKKMKNIGIIAVLIGIILSRICGDYFGSNSQVIIMGIAILFSAILIAVIVLKKYYIPAILLTSILTPVAISFFGMYFNNLYMLFGGLILFFVALVIDMKYLNSIKK